MLNDSMESLEKLKQVINSLKPGEQETNDKILKILDEMEGVENEISSQEDRLDAMFLDESNPGKNRARRMNQYKNLQKDLEIRKAGQSSISDADVQACLNEALEEINEAYAEETFAHTEIISLMKEISSTLQDLCQDACRLIIVAEEIHNPSEEFLQNLQDLREKVDRHLIKNQINNLKSEMNALNDTMVRSWPKKKLHAQLSIWAGKARRIQDHNDMKNDEMYSLVGVFGAINRLSKDHRPGYIEALNRQYVTCWRSYVATHQTRLDESEMLEQKKQVSLKAQRICHVSCGASLIVVSGSVVADPDQRWEIMRALQLRLLAWPTCDFRNLLEVSADVTSDDFVIVFDDVPENYREYVDKHMGHARKVIHNVKPTIELEDIANSLLGAIQESAQ